MADVEDRTEARESPDIAMKSIAEGTKSATLPPANMVVLGLLAGLFIALGGLVSTTVASGDLPHGLAQFLSGLLFTVGLAMVIVGGSELFTGNTMTIPIARFQKEVTGAQLATNWSIVFVANFVGSVLVALLMVLSAQYTGGDGVVGEAALATAERKAGLSFVEALASGILANFLVCMAVWLSYSGRSTVDKIGGLLLPIWAFVAADLEHSVANMYLVPAGLFIKDLAPDGFWDLIGTSAAAYPDLTWSNFLVTNLLPVTIGNIIGGMVLVAAAYWFVHLRD